MLTQRFFPALTLMVFLAAAGWAAPPPNGGPLTLSPHAQSQIDALQQEKASRTPAQQRLDSNLLYQSKIQRGQAIAPGVPTLRTGIKVENGGLVLVDIKAEVTPALLTAITRSGGRVVSSYPLLHSVRAHVPLASLEAIASVSGVSFIRPAEQWLTQSSRHSGPLVPGAVKVNAALPARLASPLNDTFPLNTAFSFNAALPAAAMPIRGTGTTFDQRAESLRAQLTAQIQKLAQTRKSPTTKSSVANAAGSLPQSFASDDPEGDVAHRADLARAKYHANGSGIKVGVLSDGVDSLSTAESNGDLPTVHVLAAGSGDEGTAMLEIVHRLAPGASLDFATAGPGQAGFASNIRALRADGCNIIVDDVFYFNESPFQDDVVAQAVDDVTVGGAEYYSSAGNGGSALYGTSAVWEGDYTESGYVINSTKGGYVASFGTNSSGNQILGAQVHSPSYPAYLFWADPLGHSSNDYDLYVLSSDFSSIVASSTNTQNGSQDPVEAVGGLSDGQQLLVIRASSAAPRYFRVQIITNGYGTLTPATGGQTKGHADPYNAYAAFSIAATSAAAVYPGTFSASNGVESFSADGPRHMFFDRYGNEITPGNESSSGGSVTYRPDFTAADGVSTSVSGFDPFYGTSAAAPHAAAIAALIDSDVPGLTGYGGYYERYTATDILASGFDFNSGTGIADALNALAFIAPGNDNFSSAYSLGSGVSGSTTGSNYGASTETGEPLNAGRTGYHSVWWSWTAPTTGSYNFNTAGSNYDTTLGIYTGSSVGGLTTIAGSDDSGGTLQSSVTFYAVAGTTYYISVDGFGGHAGNITLSYGQGVPVNDNFINARNLGNSAPGTIADSNVLATKETGEPNHGARTGGTSVWYYWTAPSTADYNFNTVGSDFDTLIGVYTGSSVDALTTVAGNDDSDSTVQSSASFHAVSGTVYYIAVDGYAAHTGNIVLNWQKLGLTGLSLSPSAISVGQTTTGTVTLNLDASQTGGSVVTLHSSNSQVTLPATVTVAAGKTVTFSAKALSGTVGSVTLTATYNGTSKTATLTVSKSTPSLTVTSINGTVGQTVTLYATLVRAADSLALSGRTLTFKVGSTTVGTGTTNSSGVATKSYAIPSGSSAGTQTITVSYAGDSSYNSVTQTGTLTQKVQAAITVANASGAIGQTVTLSATLKRADNSAALVGKTLTFTVNGASVGTGTTNSSGVATKSYHILSTLSVGTHSISVSFAGDTNNLSISGAGTLTVTKGVTALAVANLSGAIGQTVTLSATLTRSPDSLALSGKSLTFTVNGVSLGTATTSSSGVATKSYHILSTLSVGTHSISVSFAGDTTYLSKTGTGTLTVTKGVTHLAVANISGTHGNTVTLSATLTRSPDSLVLSGKTLTFTVNGASVGTGTTNSSGVATKSYHIPSSPTSGTQTISVAFAGDSTYLSTGGSGTLTIH